MFLAAFPFAHSGCAGVEHGREHDLANAQALAQGTNASAVVGRNRFEAKCFKLVHLAFVDKAMRVQVKGGFVNRVQNPAFCVSFGVP